MAVKLNSIIVKPLDAEMLFIEASRYAFGRSTYASGMTAEIVGKYIEWLSPKACYVIAKDVREGIEEYKRGVEDGYYSEIYYEIDIKPWEDILTALDERAKLAW